MPINPVVSMVPHAETHNPRRAALKQMAGIFGLTLSAQALDVLAATKKNPVSLATQLLTPEQLLMTAEIAELIIPATDTPGALAANVHGFIDQYLAQCVSKSEQRSFISGLKKINTVATQKINTEFLTADKNQKTELLTWIEKTSNGFTPNDKKFFTQFKSLTLLGYYTSEIGATQELAYVAIPGGFKGNYPFAKTGKAWSLN
ncbi:MAG: gluconate 2-dehydrogenase subunit 3 family protein [Gammaproteobacteria bacterium]|nr:gluconate 2-dehydrogenase subunit 3 family protein [Gammaproteobacteria bacterium]